MRPYKPNQRFLASMHDMLASPFTTYWPKTHWWPTSSIDLTFKRILGQSISLMCNNRAVKNCASTLPLVVFVALPVNTVDALTTSCTYCKILTPW